VFRLTDIDLDRCNVVGRRQLLMVNAMWCHLF